MKAYYGIELDYVFGSLGKAKGYDEIDFSLSDAIMTYWTNFAKTGNPNGSGLQEWPQYKFNTDLSLDFGDRITAKANVDKKGCDAVIDVGIAQQKHLQDSINAGS